MRHSGLWHVYLIECSDGSLYCGITTDLARRLGEHKRGVGARYTRGRRPAILRACLACRDRRAALRLEARIKALPRSRKLEFFGEAL